MPWIYRCRGKILVENTSFALSLLSNSWLSLSNSICFSSISLIFALYDLERSDLYEYNIWKQVIKIQRTISGACIYNTLLYKYIWNQQQINLIQWKRENGYFPSVFSKNVLQTRKKFGAYLGELKSQ